MLEIISLIVIIVSLNLIFIGFQIWKKQKVSLLHNYHHEKVKEENKANYCEEIGKCLIALGVNTMLTLVVIRYDVPVVICVAIISLIYICVFAKMVKIQSKYNKL